MTTTSARWALIVVGVVAPAVAAEAQPQRECFGGAPTAVVTGEKGAAQVTVVGDSMFWVSAQGLRRMPLGGHQKTTVSTLGDLEIKAIDGKLAVGATDINDLEGVDLPSGKRRMLVEGHETMEEPLLFSTLALDDKYLYFGRGENEPPRTRPPRVGFHRLRRGGGAPELLGGVPDGNTVFTVANGYVYWRTFSRLPGSERYVAELARRRLQKDAPVQVLAPLRWPEKEPLFVGGGRVYYVDGGMISSVPVGGGAAPTVHAHIGDGGVVDLVADGNCVYWVDAAGTVQRAQGEHGAVERLDSVPGEVPRMVERAPGGQGPLGHIGSVLGMERPERDKPAHALAMDGAHLYWADAKAGSIMALGRAREVAEAGVRTIVAKPAVTPSRPMVWSDRLLVGTSWGCARRRQGAAREMQCWRAPQVAGLAAPRIRARLVPWLAADHYAATADRLCALTATDARCWRPAELFGPAPADVKFAPMSTRTVWDQELAAGGGATCTEKGNVWTCSGDDSFGLLGKGTAKGPRNQLYGGNIALSAFHGCVAGESVLCWGRNDALQLGFPTAETCKIDGRDIPCSRGAKTPTFKLPGQPGIYAADTFTCTQRGAFHCWGASRDGLFGTAGECPPTLRTAFPTQSGLVAAPDVTCSVTPVEMPAFAAGQEPSSFSVGPRGACGVVGTEVKCAGAIPTPSDAVTRPDGGVSAVIGVSRGDDASACAIGRDGVACWGAGYSPPAAPAQPTLIAFTEMVVDGPAVDTASASAKEKWPAGCNVTNGCPPRPAPPPCPAALAAAAVPWSTMLSGVAGSTGREVIVRGPLLVQAHSGPDTTLVVNGGCAPAQPLAIVVGNNASPLILDGLTCEGDRSRRCCDARAFGQDVVARGQLAASGSRWILRNPQLCTAR